MNLFIDVIGLAGLALLSYGAWLAWPPAGFMAAGALLLAYAVKAATSTNPKKGEG